MPTYEYECRSCRHRFDLFQSIKSEPVAQCPRCKKRARRLISSGAGILFKGSGFYSTDYRSASYKKGKAAAESKKKSDASGKACDAPKKGTCAKKACPKGSR